MPICLLAVCFSASWLRSLGFPAPTPSSLCCVYMVLILMCFILHPISITLDPFYYTSSNNVGEPVGVTYTSSA